jgi:hypothetical protein
MYPPAFDRFEKTLHNFARFIPIALLKSKLRQGDKTG